MKQSIISTIKNGKITLPKELQAEWKKGEVIFMPAPGGFLIKSITPPSLSTIAKKLSKAARKARVTAKDINDAVAWSKKQTYESRA